MVPRKGMLAIFGGVLGPHYYGQTHLISPGRNHYSPMVFDVVLQRCPRIWIFWDRILVTSPGLDFEVFYRPDLDRIWVGVFE